MTAGAFRYENGPASTHGLLTPTTKGLIQEATLGGQDTPAALVGTSAMALSTSASLGAPIPLTGQSDMLLDASTIISGVAFLIRSGPPFNQGAQSVMNLDVDVTPGGFIGNQQISGDSFMILNTSAALNRIQQLGTGTASMHLDLDFPFPPVLWRVNPNLDPASLDIHLEADCDWHPKATLNGNSQIALDLLASLFSVDPLPPRIIRISRTKALWKWILADTETLDQIGELDKASSKRLQLALNKAGGASWNLPMTDKMAKEVQVINTSLMAHKFDAETGLWKLVWSGPVWTANSDLPNAQLSVTAVGWYELLMHRVLHEIKAYTGGLYTGGGIAQALLAYTNAVHPTLIVPGTNTDTQIRNHSFAQWEVIGSGIDELSNVENGFDWTIHPQTREFNTKGSSEFRDLEDVVFGYGWGPDNVAQFGRTIDSSVTMNKIFVTGRASTYESPDGPTISQYGLFEEQASLQDVVDPDVIEAYAAGEIVYRGQPRVIYSITPFPATSHKGRVPRPFLDYDIGDKTYLTAKYQGDPEVQPLIQIQNQAVRVFGMNVSIDDTGNEKLDALQLTAS